MRRSNKGLIIGIVLALVVMGIVFAIFSGFFKLQAFQEGLTIESISPATIISNDADLETANFIVTATAGGGQSLIGTIDQDTFLSKTGGQYRSKFPLQVEVSTHPETFNIGIVNEGVPIYSVQKERGASGFLYAPTCNERNGAGDPLYTIPEFLYGSSSASTCEGVYCFRYCWYQHQEAVIGRLSPESVKFSATIKATINNFVSTQEISANNPSADFLDASGKWFMNAKMTGASITGDFPPETASYKTVFPTGGNRWNIINGNPTYEDYKTAYTTLKTLQYTGVQDFSKFDRAVQDLNAKVLVLKSQNVAIGGYPTNPVSNDLNAGKVSIILDRRLASPRFTFLVKASSLGVYIPVGKPQLSNLACPTFKSGNPGYITGTISNVGNADGTFDVSVSGCQLSQSFSASSNRIPVRVGQPEPFSIKISEGAVAKFSDTCTVTVKDFNKPSISTTGTIGCTVETAAVCQPNSKSVSGNIIYTCNADGTKSDATVCDHGIQYDKITGQPIGCIILGTTTSIPQQTTTTKPKDGICTQENQPLPLGGSCCSGLTVKKGEGLTGLWNSIVGGGVCVKPTFSEQIMVFIPYIIFIMVGGLIGYIAGGKKNRFPLALLGAVVGFAAISGIIYFNEQPFFAKLSTITLWMIPVIAIIAFVVIYYLGKGFIGKMGGR